MPTSLDKTMDDRRLTIRHSSHCQESNKSSTNSSTYSKSDLNLPKIPKCLGSQGEYYRRYEHDEVPVEGSRTGFSNTSNNKKSLTNSELEKLETRIFKNVSQELQTDDGSLSSLESNIKFFKTTVEKLFDNFYTSMRDFEHYKRRFHAILDKSKDGSIDDMEDFIRDMFDHIKSSENSASNVTRQISHKSADTTLEPRDKDTVRSTSSTYTEPNLSTGVLEAYKNYHYLTDSTFDENAPRGNGMKVDEILNIFLLSGNPCVQIEMNDRNLLSEINIRKPSESITAGAIASADDLKTMAAKRLEVERYVKQQDHNIPERNIPVKISYAKKNIYLNEDFACNENSEPSKSLISKICNILCKKFRKRSFA